MAMSPQQMQQMLAQYKGSFGQQNPLAGYDAAQQSLGAGAPPGTNRTAGGVNAASQLILALMRAQKMKQLQQQQQQPQQPQATPTPTQGTTLSSPGGDPSMSTGGGDGQ